MTTAVIAHRWHSRYDRPTETEGGEMATEQEREDLKARVKGGEWLSVGEIAKLLDVSRSTAHRLLADGQISFRKKRRYRYGNPDDVLKVLDEYTTEHRGDTLPATDV